MNDVATTVESPSKSSKKERNLRKKLAKIASNPHIKLRTKAEKVYAQAVLSSESRKATPKPRGRTVRREQKRLDLKWHTLSERLTRMQEALLNNKDLRPFRVQEEHQYEGRELQLKKRINKTRSKLNTINRNLAV